MTPEDKKKLADAWRKAVAKHPTADVPVEGWASKDGKPVTYRQLMEATLKEEGFYQAIDKMLAAQKITLDQYIKQTIDKPAPKRGGPKL